jgi:hypothetical protein
VNPALRKALHALGFAVGFWMLLGGGAGAAAVLMDLAHADVPSLELLGTTAAYLGIPLLAFRAYDRSARPDN